MHANHREEIDEVYAGDIAAAVGLKNTFTGDTLADPEHPVILESITFPEPVIEVEIEPKTKADQDKMGLALAAPGRGGSDVPGQDRRGDGQTLIAGMGELHLEVLVDRMIREFKVAANIGRPQVSYRETIRRAAEGNGRFIRQTGGKGQYGHVDDQAGARREGRRLRVRRQDRRRDDPARVHASRSTTGVREALETGVYAGYPMVDVRATALRRVVPRGRLVGDGVQDRRLDGRQGAVEKADPAILEPIMRVEVVMPEEFMGDVIGDLNRRRGHIEGMESRGHDAGGSRVRAAGGDVRLRHGPAVDDRRAGPRYSMEIRHYAEVPGNLAAELVQKSKV